MVCPKAEIWFTPQKGWQRSDLHWHHHLSFYSSSCFSFTEHSVYHVLQMEVLGRAIRYRGKRKHSKQRQISHRKVKFQIVFPYSQSVSCKWGATWDTKILSECFADHRLSFSFHVTWFSLRELWAIPTVITKIDFESTSEALPATSLRKMEYIFIKMSWLNKRLSKS